MCLIHHILIIVQSIGVSIDNSHLHIDNNAMLLERRTLNYSYYFIYLYLFIN